MFVADIRACIFECVLWLQKSKNNIMLSYWILQVQNTVLMGTVKQLLKLDGIFLVKINNMLALMLFLSCVVSVVLVDNVVVLLENCWACEIWISCLKTSANVNGWPFVFSDFNFFSFSLEFQFYQ